uniref:F-box domain-containing protein n=1 Tax=Picea sitchensis TaxID=3332 RepID=D5A8I6_PICSI|nr:unknown [Picea sitchensis]
MMELEPKNKCCELSEHLREEILAWLPLQSLCRFRLVCKDWNALISSTRFITTKWVDKPPNRKPWLVVHLQGAPSKMPHSLAYCFFTRTWKNTSSISLSFLMHQKQETRKCLYGSAAGLFLVGCASEFVVFNPLTRRSIQLLPLSSIRYIDIFSVGIVGESREVYNVVVVGKSRTLKAHLVEIYSSTEKSWRIAGQLPEDVKVMRTGPRSVMDMVFCSDSFYFITLIEEEWGIMSFSIREGTFFSAPLPDVANENSIIPYLLACGSRVLATVGIVKEREVILQEVIIWEFQNVKAVSTSYSSSSWWKEIARMPPSLCEIVNKSWSQFGCRINSPFMCCIGVGDCACFIVKGGMSLMEVVFYSLSEKTWNCLPSCLLGEDIIAALWAGYATVMAFEPRLDMKVG